MYKPRFPFKNIILSKYFNIDYRRSKNKFTCQKKLTAKLSDQDSNNIKKFSVNTDLSETPQKGKYKKALVVTKFSHFEFERITHKNLNDDEFESKLRNRGTDFDRLIHHHRLHKGFEKDVVNTLMNLGFEVKVVNRTNYSCDKIKWADVIIPTGGDGTFLLAASRIHSNKKPVVGFNSDPSRSEGYLCLPKRYSTNIGEALQRLQMGNFSWLLRNRIRTTVFQQKDNIMPKDMHYICRNTDFEYPWYEEDKELLKSSKVLPFLALNEVFIGESLSARVSHLEMWLNGEENPFNIKCSGLCVSSGTGSTSWHLSINRLPTQSVAELLRLLDIEPTEDKDSLATVLADIYNKNLIFDPGDKRLGYTIRDLISAGVWPQPKGIKSRGFVSKLKVKSKCFDACLVVDGGISFAFNDGCVAILETHPGDALRTVVFPD